MPTQCSWHILHDFKLYRPEILKLSRSWGIWISGFEGLEVSRTQSLKVSRSQDLKISRSHGVSRFQDLMVSGLKVTESQIIKVSKSQGLKITESRGLTLSVSASHCLFTLMRKNEIISDSIWGNLKNVNGSSSDILEMLAHPKIWLWNIWMMNSDPQT